MINSSKPSIAFGRSNLFDAYHFDIDYPKNDILMFSLPELYLVSFTGSQLRIFFIEIITSLFQSSFNKKDRHLLFKHAR